MRDGLHVLSLVESKYLATKSVSASDSLALNTGVWLASSTFPFFPRGMNCSIDSSIDTTSGNPSALSLEKLKQVNLVKEPFEKLQQISDQNSVLMTSKTQCPRYIGK
ncbi:hypothetical protein RHGRI_031531 [Rhododendron griersonianum]|uniref:Uncharacterized protein n=1 Tax=Rhododendron griersonianum TaxID=479676 RepID=A0AAV6I8N8_9ERIC|nr:hypothetical protein RHGRI_031531 [Rhododendron griersonianum]